MASMVAPVNDSSDDLLGDPIAWFFSEHQRHRKFCDLMQRSALSTIYDERVLCSLLEFVVDDLGLHVLDEEQDLFPLLRARARPEDMIERVLGRLAGEHEKDLRRAAAVRSHLESCLRMGVPIGRSNKRRNALQAFAIQERSHLALENAVVLPIARLRLTPQDLADLRRRIAKRRGLHLATRPRRRRPVPPVRR